MRPPILPILVRVLAAGALALSVALFTVACGGDDSRYGGEKSGSFQMRSGISWGN